MYEKIVGEGEARKKKRKKGKEGRNGWEEKGKG